MLSTQVAGFNNGVTAEKNELPIVVVATVLVVVAEEAN
jgi:hypothetical protein